MHRLAEWIEALSDRIGAATRWLALAMVLVGAYNALARWATRWANVSLSSNALNELQWYMFSIIFLLGAAYGLRVDAHVRVDVVYERMSVRVKGWIDLLGTLLFLLPFTVVMLWVSFPTVRNSFQIREVSPDPGGLPRWPIKALILVSFALLALQGVATAIRAIQKIRGASGPDEDGGGPTAGGVIPADDGSTAGDASKGGDASRSDDDDPGSPRREPRTGGEG